MEFRVLGPFEVHDGDQEIPIGAFRQRAVLALLTIHGVLHLLGYDHAEADEEKEMFALQRQLLEEWVAEQVKAYQQDRQSEKDRLLLDKSQFFDEQ